MTKMYVASALPRGRFVTGPSGDVGYIAKRPGHGADMEKILQDRARNRLVDLRERKERRGSMYVAHTNRYYRGFDKLTVRAPVGRMVELGIQEADNYFKVKQNKMRQLFLEENSAFVEEYTTKALTSLEKKLYEEKLKAEEILNSKTDAEKLKAQQIYANMVMKNSQEFVDKLRLVNLRNASETNREQIRLKENQRLMEREEDIFWEEERRKVFCLGKCELDDTEEERHELYESLKRQIADEEVRRRRKACVEEIEEERNREIRKVWEDKLTRRDEEARSSRLLHDKALAQQVELNRVLAEKYKREEKLMAKIMAEDNRKKAEREAAAYVFNKLNAWDELVTFKESVVQYRKDVAAYEEENQRGIEENRKTLERKSWEARKATETAQRDLIIDCSEASRRMVKEKAKKLAELKYVDSKRLELLKMNKNINERLDVELAHQKQVDRVSYNEAQSKYMDALVEREKQEDEEMLRKMRQNTVDNVQRVQKSMAMPIGEVAGTAIHPFYKMVREQHNS